MVRRWAAFPDADQDTQGQTSHQVDRDGAPGVAGLVDRPGEAVTGEGPNRTAGGDPKAQQCGWLKDKFGLSWQVLPTALGELLGDPDPARARRAGRAR